MPKESDVIISRDDILMFRRVVIKNMITLTLVFYFFFFLFFGKLFIEFDYYIPDQARSVMLGVGFILILVGAYIRESIRFKNFDFEFSDDSGVIRSRAFSTSVTRIYYDKVQDVIIKRGILDKILGTSLLVIETAGGRRGEASIYGISPEGAERIKDFLLSKIDVRGAKL